jgi:hypothetical protein
MEQRRPKHAINNHHRFAFVPVTIIWQNPTELQVTCSQVLCQYQSWNWASPAIGRPAKWRFQRFLSDSVYYRELQVPSELVGGVEGAIVAQSEVALGCRGEWSGSSRKKGNTLRFGERSCQEKVCDVLFWATPELPIFVGAPGFEPGTSWSRKSVRSRLSAK